MCSDLKETKLAKQILCTILPVTGASIWVPWVASGEMKFVYCKSKENVSDCLTKALPRPLLEAGSRGLGMLSDQSNFLEYNCMLSTCRDREVSECMWI
jgi:hypothetical protein